MKKFNDWEVENIQMDGIDYNDAPDFCNAFISRATIDGHKAKDEELDELNDDSDFVYDCLMDYLY